MKDMDEELTIGPGTTLRVLSRTDEVLEVEATYAGGGTPPPAHLHPDQGERFEVRAGAMRTRIAGREGEIAAGEQLEIPIGTVHQMWNDGETPAVVNWKTMPAGRMLEWFRELAALARGESLGDPSTLLSRYSDVFLLAEDGQA